MPTIAEGLREVVKARGGAHQKVHTIAEGVRELAKKEGADVSKSDGTIAAGVRAIQLNETNASPSTLNNPAPTSLF